MLTRRDILNIKPGSAAEVGRIFKDEVLLPLCGEKGMRHEDIFISPVLSEAVLNSYWDSQECADSKAETSAVYTSSAGLMRSSRDAGRSSRQRRRDWGTNDTRSRQLRRGQRGDGEV